MKYIRKKIKKGNFVWDALNARSGALIVLYVLFEVCDNAKNLIVLWVYYNIMLPTVIIDYTRKITVYDLSW